MNMSERISVIVPVYKVEPYLRRCVDSILAQTYTHLEIILVDDGSPDHCPAICDEYAEKDSRVRVIHKLNGGLSDARNVGLELVSGEWISFVDSDDWIEPTMYETLLHHAVEHDAQISIGGVSDELLNDDGIVIFKMTAGKTVETAVREKSSAIQHFLTHPWSAWDKIYRRDVFNGICYPVGEINEDEAIALYLLNRCDRVVYTNEVFYHYIRRPESITTSTFSPKKFAWYRHCRDNLAWIREHHPELTEAAAARYRGALMWTLTEVALSDTAYPAEQQDMRTELRGGRKLFSKIPFDSTNEWIRFMVLSYLPFPLYRFFIRRKRNV